MNQLIDLRPELTGKALSDLRFKLSALRPAPPVLPRDLVPRQGCAVPLSEDGHALGDPSLWPQFNDAPGALQAIPAAWAVLASEEVAFSFRRRLPESVAVALVEATPDLAARALYASSTGPLAPPAPFLASQEDYETLEGLDLGSCRRLLARQLLKKVWVRRFCRQQALETFRIYYAFYRPGGEAALTHALDEVLRLQLARIDFGAGPRIIERGRLMDALAEGAALNPVAGGFVCVQVSEVVEPETQGFSSLLAGGAVWIEAFPGGLRGAKSGRYTPSTALVSPDGRFSGSQSAPFTGRVHFDPAMFDWVEVSSPAFRLEVSVAEAEGIAAVTRALSQRFGEVRLEWYLSAGRVWVKDVSFEAGPLPRLAARVISAGAAVGPVFHLRDCAALDRAAAELGASVVQHSAWLPNETIDAQVAALRAAGRPLVVAEYPSIGLLPLVPHAAGFIFSRAPLLCHAAIVLRESRCPAAVVPDAFDRLPEGAVASVRDGEIAILSGGRP